MKLTEIIDNILLEATPDEIYASYYKDIPKEEFNQIVMGDPQSILDGDVVKRIGKYAKLLLNMYRKKTLKLEDTPKAKEYLEYVYKHKISLDVNKIKSLNDLYDVVKGYYARDTRDLNSIVSALPEKEYSKVFEDDKWVIFVPLTEKASCYLGVNTEWCTTWGKQSLNPKHQDRGSLFVRYHAQGALFILINKSDINDKYQFHFQSKQYMDKDDRKIDVGKFLSDNEGVRNYFFPSFINDSVSESVITQQIEKLNALNDDYRHDLVTKIVSQEKSRNPLIGALVSEDLDEISKYITDDEIKDIDIYREDIVFELKGDLMGDLSSLYDTLNYYKSDADNAYEMLWDRMNNEDSDYIKDVLEHYFKIYYEQNSEDLKSDFGYMSYDDFKNDHYENFVEDGNLWDEYSSIYVDKNEQHLRAESQSRVDEITKYIDIENRYRGDSTVNVNIAFLILFLIKNDYSVIDGKDTYFSDVMSDYISSNNLDSEYEGIWDHQVDEVTYEEFKEDIESYFEGVLTDMESIKKCATYRKTFNDIVQKVFKGGTYLDTDDFTIRLNSNKIDCGDGTVEIFYTNKKSNENYRGKYKVENLAALVTNYKLFENTIRFKNIIK